MSLCPNARDENLNSTEKSLTSQHVSVCTACDSVLDMVRRVCRTVF